MRDLTAVLVTIAADPDRLAAVDPADLPELIGAAAALQARLQARLLAGQPAPAALARNGGGPDTLLTAAEAAERLGVGVRWVYRHAGTLPFTRLLSSGTLRFSSRGLERWQEGRRIGGTTTRGSQ